MKDKNKKPIFKKYKIKNDIFKKKKQEHFKFSDKEVENSLKEIYGDNDNNLDLRTIKTKKKRSAWLSGLYFFLFIVIIAAISYGVYNYIKSSKDVSSVLRLSVDSPENLSLGEEFSYNIKYENSSNYNLKNVKIEIQYPDNFLISDFYSIHDSDEAYVFYINNLGPKVKGSIEIKGKIINQVGVNNSLYAKASYNISGLSSDFSKEAFSSLSLDEAFFQFDSESPGTVLVGENNFLDIKIKDFPRELMDHFKVSFSDLDNLDLSLYSHSDDKMIEDLGDNNFMIDSSLLKEDDIVFRFSFNDKVEDEEIISMNFKYLNDKQEIVFFKKDFRIEVIKSDLHLNLLIDDSDEPGPVSFGDKLDYSIHYSNKGDKSIKDLIIMLVIDSDFLDWAEIENPDNGILSDGYISWSSDEFADLKELDPGEEGVLNFSVNLSDFTEIDFGQNFEVESYAQFNIGNIQDFDDEDESFLDNRSNIIIQKINSNLSFQERVLYFDDNNIPVGSGPLPPVVGEKTSFRYYWNLENTLHELRDIELSLKLPEYVIWENDFNLEAGNINFDPDNNEVIWTISRWPLGIDEIESSFNVSIIPREEEHDKIMVLSNGSELEAFDVETKDLIIKNTNVKTTKLKDDPIAAFNNDGRVVE
jgi:hypothetical protein